MRADWILAFALSMASPAMARDPVGKTALDAIAPIGASIEEARSALAGLQFDEIDGPNGTKVLIADDVSVGLCGAVYGVTRLLGRSPADAMEAVLTVSAFAGSPMSEVQKVVGGNGAQSLKFSWPSIPDYSIDVIKSDAHWVVHESTFREGFCENRN